MLSMLKTTHNKCLLGDFNARSGKSKHICLDNISANHNDMDEKIRQSLEHINVLLDLKFPLKGLVVIITVITTCIDIN